MAILTATEPRTEGINVTESGKFEGVSGVLITPFHEGSLDVDEAALRKVARTMDEGGIDVIVPCGGTGEFYSLTDSERRQVTEVVLDEVSNAEVVIGVGRDLRSAVEAARHAEEHGAAGVMVHQPAGGGISGGGLLDYYCAIADAVSIDLVAYARHPLFTGEFIANLARQARVVAVKYSMNDLRLFASTVDRAGPDANVTWICGTAESWAPFFWPAGAQGFTSGLANFAPEKSAELANALKRGDMTRARRAWAELLPLEELRDRHSGANNVSVVKSAAEARGLCSGAVRPPLRPISSSDKTDLESILQSWALPVGASSAND